MPATISDRLYGLETSVAIKPPCVAVALSNITLSGLQTVNSVPILEGDRVLVAGQADPKQNGIYNASISSWIRAADFDGNRDVVQGTLVLIRNRIADGAIFEVISPNPIIIGTSSINFELRDDPAITYAQSQPEIANVVAPTNTHYVWGHALRYGTANDAVRLQATIDCGHKAFWPDANYTLGTTSLVLRSNLRIEAESIGGVVLTYTGSGTAISAIRKSNIVISPGFTVMTTDPAAIGMGLEGSMRHISLGSLLLYGDTSASNSGIGLELAGGSVGQAYSGSLHVKLLNTLGYKYGIRAIGTDASATWTTMTFEQVLINGRSAGVIAGSKGIWFDALTNGVGSICLAGAIQSFAVPVQFDNGSFGMHVNCDMEGNTSNSAVLGASALAEIINSGAGGDRYDQRSFLGEAVFRRLIQTGRVTQETKFGPKIIVTNASGGAEDIASYRGASALDGGSPTIVDGVHVSTSDDLLDPSRNWRYCPNGVNKECWGSADPTGGTWTKGDIRWNTSVAAAGSPGSVCTTSGTYSAATDNTGDTDGSTSLIIGLADTSDFFVGQFVTISAGFSTTGPFRINALSSSTMNVNANSNSAQSNVTISTPDPIWKALAVVAA